VSIPILRHEGVEAIYDRSILALRGFSLEVREGAVVALLGANGAGKTTAMKAVSNLLRVDLGQVTRGRILYKGKDITNADPADLVERGIVQVLEGRHCFPHLSVEDNLIMGATSAPRARRILKEDIGKVYALFPRLRDRAGNRAGYLSGGEQQMLALGRALMARPTLVLLDEPSMGLAPQVVEEIFGIIRTLNRTQGVTFLLAEQNATMALRYADHGYLVENGRVPSEGTAADLLSRDDVKSFYLGGNEADRSPPGRDRPRRPEFSLA
jgi:branched-chain amino acid transport system ATP-binding protein